MMGLKSSVILVPNGCQKFGYEVITDFGAKTQKAFLLQLILYHVRKMLAVANNQQKVGIGF